MSGIPFLYNVDLNQNQILNAVLQVLSTDPANPVEGQLWYNSGDNVIKYYDGEDVIILGEAGQMTIHDNDFHNPDFATATDLSTHASADAPHSKHENTDNKGSANGYAGLDSNGVVPSAQLPASATYQVHIVADENARDEISNPNHGDKAFLLDSGRTYIWDENEGPSGAWVLQAKSDFSGLTIYWANLENGPDSTVANIDDAVGKRHEHDNAAVINGIDATDVSNWDGAHSHTSNTENPHGVDAEDVGLGSVDNKSSATIRGELTKENVTDALDYTPVEPFYVGIGNGASTELNVQHKLGLTFVHVVVRETMGDMRIVHPLIEVVDNDNIKLKFSQPPDLNEYTAIVMAGPFTV